MSIKEQWTKWSNSLPERIELPRCNKPIEETTESIDLHVFCDASLNGVGANVYAIIHQGHNVTQGLLTAKARLAKRDLTFPRLELVAAHMAANLVHSVRKALEGSPVREVYAWSNSSVALSWIKGHKQYKQFVSNRVSRKRVTSYGIISIERTQLM